MTSGSSRHNIEAADMPYIKAGGLHWNDDNALLVGAKCVYKFVANLLNSCLLFFVVGGNTGKD